LIKKASGRNAGGFFIGGYWLINWPIIYGGAYYFWTTRPFPTISSGSKRKRKNPLGHKGMKTNNL
jgi:hypothetical protein